MSNQTTDHLRSSSAKTPDDLLAHVTANQPIVAVITGTVTDKQTGGPAGFMFSALQGLPAAYCIPVLLIGIITYIVLPVTGVTSSDGRDRLFLSLGVAGLVGLAARMAFGISNPRIHDAVAIGKEQVWVISQCRQKSGSPVTSCLDVHVFPRTHATFKTNSGVPFGDVVISIRIGSGTLFPNAHYELTQGSGHDDKRYFTNNVVSISEALSLLASDNLTVPA